MRGASTVPATADPADPPTRPDHQAGRRRRTRISLAILTVVYLCFALTFSLLTRAWEANDEPDHVQYAELIILNGRLPQIGPAQGDESHQPPLYYLALAGWQELLRLTPFRAASVQGPWSMFGSGSAVPAISPKGLERKSDLTYEHDYTALQHRAAVELHELRLLSVIFGLGTVLLAYASARVLRLGEGVALSVGLFVALLPKEIVVSSVVTNDSLVGLLCAASLTCFLMAERLRVEGDARRRRRYALGTGVLLGAAAITKVDSLPVAAVLFVLLAWAPMRMAYARLRRRSARLDPRFGGLALDVVVAVGAFVVVSGWWFVRNLDLYGSLLATRQADDNVTRLTLGLYHPTDHYGEILLHIVPTQVFKSFWYDGGWNMLRLPPLLNGVLAVLGLAALGAGIWVVVRRRRPGDLWPAALVGSVLAAAIACVMVARATSHVEGRIAFVGLCAIAVLLTLGASEALRGLGWSWAGLAAWPVVLLAVDVYVLTHFTIPLAGL